MTLIALFKKKGAEVQLCEVLTTLLLINECLTLEATSKKEKKDFQLEISHRQNICTGFSSTI